MKSSNQNLEPGWWWYQYKTEIGTNYVPVYVEQNSDGEWFIKDAPGEKQNSWIGDVDGKIVSLMYRSKERN